MKDKKREEKNFGVRTDLAIESRELLDEGGGGYNGIESEEKEIEDIKITYVRIKTEEGSRSMGKPIGTYITIESEKMRENDISYHEKLISIASKCIRELAKPKARDTVLVVGLGNWNITPDALGPKTVSKVLVTRHIFDGLPEEINGAVCSAAAISPGVMGITGIETGEIIKGVTEKLKPELIIVIDALAARKFSRINATIQMSDTGVYPGSGVGNKRKELSKRTLGVPVIAIGVPTVVDAATLISDTMEGVIKNIVSDEAKNERLKKVFSLSDDEKYSLVKEMLEPNVRDMFVTPKDIDAVISHLANILANAINIAIHQGITMDDINKFSY